MKGYTAIAPSTPKSRSPFHKNQTAIATLQPKITIAPIKNQTAIAPPTPQNHDRHFTKKNKQRSPLQPQNHDRHSTKIKQRSPLSKIKITIAPSKKSNSDRLEKYFVNDYLILNSFFFCFSFCPSNYFRM